MNKNINNTAARSPDERAAWIEKVANEIITEAEKSEAQRRRHNETEMEKLKRFLSAAQEKDSKAERGKS
ncbi:hypothetical protein [Pedosphaera parvula]|uniref:Uncharacterized protein n=1 Tax=Pedosphaera parvula (strain Ellin514) TaxID=320771 RepID=B9XI14_PEDPL|nr:hypothetical protein [Pedosphaera parvula]EEF60507.1 hypothetical protein Cflav_PD3477 [Pedosphaera parvula Ellin514]